MIKELEFDKVLNIVSRYCHSAVSCEKTLEIAPLPGIEEVGMRSKEVSDIRRLSAEGTPLNFYEFSDISPLIERARPEDSVLEPIELSSFRPVFEMTGDFSLISERTDIPHLAEIASGLTGFPEIMSSIKKSVDSEGNVLDTASRELMNIRARKRSLEARIRKRLDEMVKEKGIALFVQDEFVTQRSGRWVIPVRMDSKGQVPGVVHDVSRSGDTAFIEPVEIIGHSNEIEGLAADEKAEIIRILKSLTSRIRESDREIARQFGLLVYLDVLSSIALFSDRLMMSAPEVGGSGTLQLRGARHPLLALIKGRETVPLDLSLSPDEPVMVITGPNAGGKTIAVKTAGLLLLMALSGMHVPADSSSVFPFISRVLVDIGDEQSIESSMSTFSAHIANISRILGTAGDSSLVIMDELGTGTDPSEGAAIACAVLGELKRKRSLVLATTHLVDIVGFVHKTEGMTNASMEFDMETLAPLYRLRTGEPGQSHALDIARRFGLPDEVIALARERLGGMKEELRELINELKEKRTLYEEAAASQKEKERTLLEREALIKKKLRELEADRESVMRKAYEEASEIVLKTKREVSAAIEEEKKTKKALKRLTEAQAKIQDKMEETLKIKEELALKAEEIKIGDLVFVRSLGRDARVIGIDERLGRVRVEAQGISLEAPVASIGPASGKERVKKGEVTSERKDGVAAFTLNIIGLRVDEALPLIEKFLNDASMAGLERVEIIHGIGTGALKRAVREYLDGHPLVGQARKGARDGVTEAALK